MTNSSTNSTVTGIGTDIIEIERIEEAIERHKERFLNRIFTEKEQRYCLKYKKNAAVHFAGRFAAKEAILKALGSKLDAVGWKEMEILNDSAGKPIVNLSTRLASHFRKSPILLSISHCRQYAIATAILIE